MVKNEKRAREQRPRFQPLVRESLGKPISRADRFPSSHVRVRLLSPLILFLSSPPPPPPRPSPSFFFLLSFCFTSLVFLSSGKGSLVQDNKLRKQWWNEGTEGKGEADLTKVYYIHFTGKRPIYLIIRNLHNGQLACLVTRVYTRIHHLKWLPSSAARLERNTLGRWIKNFSL